MEKKQGRVFNYVVNNVEVVSDVLETMLCRNGVSYVHVDNEFHCFDKILRFFSFDEYKQLQELMGFVGEEDGFIRCVDPTMLNLSRTADELKKSMFIEEESLESLDEEEKTPTYTKRMREQSSHEVNDRLRQNKGVKSRIINRNRCDL